MTGKIVLICAIGYIVAVVIGFAQRRGQLSTNG